MLQQEQEDVSSSLISNTNVNDLDHLLPNFNKHQDPHEAH